VKRLICFLRLHWLFDHAVSYNALFDAWSCKHCGLEVQFWPKVRKRIQKEPPHIGESGS